MNDIFVVSCEFGTHISSIDQNFHFSNWTMTIRVCLYRVLKDLWVLGGYEFGLHIYIYGDLWYTLKHTTAVLEVVSF